MESGDSIVKIISGIASRRHVVEKMLVLVATVQFYDWLLTLPREVRYIWHASWNWSKVLYLFTRYTPFIAIALEIRNQFSPSPTPESCKRTLQAICWLSVVGLDFAEVILAVRTYAVWREDKRVGIGLALLLGLCQIPIGITLERFIDATNFIENPYPEIHQGCVWDGATRLVFVDWVIFTIGEGAVLVLMVISAVNTYRVCRSNLMNVIYGDGIRFYVYIFCATLANVLATLLLPIDFVAIGSDVEVVLHSILTCRLMIGIREASQSSRRKPDTFELSEVPRHSTLEFARRPSGESVQMDPEACA